MMQKLTATSDLLYAALMLEEQLAKHLPQGDLDGEACSMMRRQHEVSLSELAESAGLPESVVTAYECGEHVSLAEREAICRAFAGFLRKRAIQFAGLSGGGSSIPN